MTVKHDWPESLRATALTRFVRFLPPRWLRDLIPELQMITLPEENSAEFCPKIVSIANRLAKLNVDNSTGGPFGAIVVDLERGAIVGAGVNRVVPFRCSPLHAEICALMDAQVRLKTNDLSTTGRHALASSSKMCGMCQTAVLWSGVSLVTYGADGSDVESILGFDEGCTLPEQELIEAYAARGILLHPKVDRDECVETLRAYKTAGGIIY